MPGKKKKGKPCPKKRIAMKASKPAPLDDRAFVMLSMRELWDTFSGLGPKWRLLAQHWYKLAVKGDEIATKALAEMYRADSAGRDRSIDLFRELLQPQGNQQTTIIVDDSQLAEGFNAVLSMVDDNPRTSIPLESKTQAVGGQGTARRPTGTDMVGSVDGEWES